MTKLPHHISSIAGIPGSRYSGYRCAADGLQLLSFDEGVRHMQRRALVALPGLAAFAASRAFSETRATDNEGALPSISRKALVKHSGSKSAYKVPKTAAKQAKYINSLGALLTLTTSQKQQAATIFTSAAGTGASIRTNLKTARKELRTAVQNNDVNGISQAATTLGTVTSQHISNGARANAALFQLLTPDQQAKFSGMLG